MLAIIGGKIYTITDGIIEKGTILIEDGKILKIGKEVVVPSGVKVIDASGKIVMPGLIDAHCHIGINEEGSGSSGSDGNEATDPATPQMRALDGIKANAEEGGITVALETGITTVQVLPGSANVIGGTGVVIKTVPKVIADDMVLRNPSGMKVAFGENPKRVYGQGMKRTPSTRMGVAYILREWLMKTKLYMEKKEKAANTESEENGKKDKVPDYDYKLEALIPVLKKEIPLRCHAHRADDISVAVRIAEEFDIDISWEHATEGHRIADWIAKKGISCIYGPALMGRGKWEMRELDFKTPKVLYDAGVKLALQTDAIGRSIQFLPVAAAFAVKHGLPYDEALKAITINSAEILGVADRVGSLEVGKDADIRILSGEPLDIMSHVELVLVEGEVVYKRA